MKTPREFACNQTSRSAQLACAGNDGGEHDVVCNLVTLAVDLRDQQHAQERDALAKRLDEADRIVRVLASMDCFVSGARCAHGCDCLSAQASAAARAPALAPPLTAELLPDWIPGPDGTLVCTDCEHEFCVCEDEDETAGAHP